MLPKASKTICPSAPTSSCVGSRRVTSPAVCVDEVAMPVLPSSRVFQTVASLPARGESDAVSDRQHRAEPALGAEQLRVQPANGAALVPPPPTAELVRHFDVIGEGDRP